VETTKNQTLNPEPISLDHGEERWLADGVCWAQSLRCRNTVTKRKGVTQVAPSQTERQTGLLKRHPGPGERLLAAELHGIFNEEDLGRDPKNSHRQMLPNSTFAENSSRQGSFKGRFGFFVNVWRRKKDKAVKNHPNKQKKEKKTHKKKKKKRNREKKPPKKKTTQKKTTKGGDTTHKHKKKKKKKEATRGTQRKQSHNTTHIHYRGLVFLKVSNISKVASPSSPWCHNGQFAS